jgi:hypothetical protein
VREEEQIGMREMKQEIEEQRIDSWNCKKVDGHREGVSERERDRQTDTNKRHVHMYRLKQKQAHYQTPGASPDTWDDAGREA